MGAPRCPGRFLFELRADQLSGATGVISGVAGLAAGGAAGGGAAAGVSCGAGAIGSIEPAASCGAAAGRLRGTGGRPGVTAADFGLAWLAGGKPVCGGWPCGAISEPGGA